MATGRSCLHRYLDLDVRMGVVVLEREAITGCEQSQQWLTPPCESAPGKPRALSPKCREIFDGSGAGEAAPAGPASANVIQIVRMIKTIGAYHRCGSEEFHRDLIHWRIKRSFVGFHRFLVALPPVRVLLLFAKHLFVAARTVGHGLHSPRGARDGLGTSARLAIT